MGWEKTGRQHNCEKMNMKTSRKKTAFHSHKQRQNSSILERDFSFVVFLIDSAYFLSQLYHREWLARRWDLAPVKHGTRETFDDVDRRPLILHNTCFTTAAGRKRLWLKRLHYQSFVYHLIRHTIRAKSGVFHERSRNGQKSVLLVFFRRKMQWCHLRPNGGRRTVGDCELYR
jgi:hypothetical protein